MKPWEDPRIARGMTMQLAKRRERLNAGEKHLGWKMGFGAPAAMEKLGLKAPLIGYLMQGALLSSGAAVNLKGWTQPVAEPEIAVRLAKRIAPGATPDEARAAVASLAPAVEMADLHLAATSDNIDAVLAADIYQRHVVLGEQSRTGCEIAGLSSKVTRRGRLAAEAADPEALTGKITDLLVHLADTLDAFGETVQTGDLIICGSTVPPPLIEPDEDEFTYELAPVGTVSVRFTRD
jgi:2-keto-4-pentenoate hydratase